MRIVAGIAAALVLTGCASTLKTPHAVLERGEISGELAYQAVVDALDSALLAGKLSQAKHDEEWRAAWADLSAFRTLYNAGQDVTGALDTLRNDLATAKGVK